MFSKSVFTTMVLAAFAIAPIVAQTPPRGRPNHADLYGYPHGLPKPPPGTPRQPITPGGFMDPRQPNTGAACTRNNQCVTRVVNARALCGADNTCTFGCLGRTTFDAVTGTCVGQIVAPRCSFDRQCPTNVANAAGVCVAGRCSFACNNDFYARGSTCVAADTQCGGVTCPDVPGGYTVCVDNQCAARCEAHLGFRQYCNADNTVCQCINIANDINNCGAPGVVCPASYNGKGQAYCAAGQCGLSCHRLTKITPRDAPAYCT